MLLYSLLHLCGDGCLMEGISSEAASAAGQLKLVNLKWICDNNHITIEGSTSLTFSEDVASRFAAYGWNVTRVRDGIDLELLAGAFNVFKNTPDRPTLFIVDSHIGYGARHRHDTREVVENASPPLEETTCCVGYCRCSRGVSPMRLNSPPNVAR